MTESGNKTGGRRSCGTLPLMDDNKFVTVFERTGDER